MGDRLARMTRRVLAAGVTFAALVAVSLGGAPGALSAQALPQLDVPLTGRDSFDRYCASCHGASGRGDGPVAKELRSRPADLTTLARRNNGAFPAARVRDFVVGTGRTPAAHGPTEMPIWGSLFRAFESDERVRVRLDNLVSHVETLQVRSTGPNDAGSQLFRTYCASCHGTDARGSGPVAVVLRRMPPDLTMFAASNGGVFPSERVRGIVDGRGVASHGERDMPVWGDAFRRTRGADDAVVQQRIDAIVTYLEGIQQRATY